MCNHIHMFMYTFCCACMHMQMHMHMHMLYMCAWTCDQKHRNRPRLYLFGSLLPVVLASGRLSLLATPFAARPFHSSVHTSLSKPPPCTTHTHTHTPMAKLATPLTASPHHTSTALNSDMYFLKPHFSCVPGTQVPNRSDAHPGHPSRRPVWANPPTRP